MQCDYGAMLVSLRRTAAFVPAIGAIGTDVFQLYRKGIAAVERVGDGGLKDRSAVKRAQLTMHRIRGWQTRRIAT